MSFGAVAAIGGAVIAADSAGNAADAQKDAANQTNATNRAVSRQQMELQQPFHDSGVLGNNRLLELLGLDRGYDQAEYDRIYQGMRDDASTKHAAAYGFGYDNAPGWADGDISAADKYLKRAAMEQAKAKYKPGERSSEFGSLMKNFTNEDFEKDPGYQFRMDEGMKGVEGSAAARGGLLSGAAMKAIQKYGQGFASNEFNNAWQRDTSNKTNTYNRLAGVIDSGKGASNQISNSLGQFAQNNANALGSLGNAQAAGYMGQANALNQGIGNATNYYQNQQIINKLRNPGVNMGTATGNDLSLFY
jgi:hypothetical protein